MTRPLGDSYINRQSIMNNQVHIDDSYKKAFVHETNVPTAKQLFENNNNEHYFRNFIPAIIAINYLHNK